MSTLQQALIGNAVEASILAISIAVITLFIRCGAPLRHCLWLIVLIKLLLPPGLLPAFGVSALCQQLAATFPSDQLAAQHIDVAASPPDQVAAAVAAPNPVVIDWSVWTSTAATIWACGSLAMFTWVLLRTLAVHHRLRSAEDAPRFITDAARAIARSMNLCKSPSVRVTDDCRSPMLWACGAPVIILPAAIVRRATDDFLRNVLAHELAHLKRRDHWFCWLELAAGCLYWWLPTVWWSQRQLRQAADQAADAWAVWTLGSRKAYAESLLVSIELCCARPLAEPALGWSWGGRETVARRLTMIMRDPLRHRLSRPAWLLACVVGLLALPAAPRQLQAQPDEQRRSAEERLDEQERERDRRDDRDRNQPRRTEHVETRIEIRRDGDRRPESREREELELRQTPDGRSIILPRRREGERGDEDRPEASRDQDRPHLEERRIIIRHDDRRDRSEDQPEPASGDRDPSDVRVFRYQAPERAREEEYRVVVPRTGAVPETDRRLRELEEKVDLLLREIRELRADARRASSSGDGERDSRPARVESSSRSAPARDSQSRGPARTRETRSTGLLGEMPGAMRGVTPARPGDPRSRDDAGQPDRPERRDAPDLSPKSDDEQANARRAVPAPEAAPAANPFAR